MMFTKKNSEMIRRDKDTEDTARKLMLKIANSLNAKMEISSPMACLYLLDNPDHYTSHKFAVCWWRNYVSEIMQEGSTDIHEENDDQPKAKSETSNDSDDDEDIYVSSDVDCNNANAKYKHGAMDVDSDDDSMTRDLVRGGINNALSEGEDSGDEADDKENGDDNIVLGLEDGM